MSGLQAAHTHTSSLMQDEPFSEIGNTILLICRLMACGWLLTTEQRTKVCVIMLIWMPCIWFLESSFGSFDILVDAALGYLGCELLFQTKNEKAKLKELRGESEDPTRVKSRSCSAGRTTLPSDSPPKDPMLSPAASSSGAPGQLNYVVLVQDNVRKGRLVPVSTSFL